MRHDTPSLPLKIGDQLLVFDFEHHTLGEHVAPMHHQSLVRTVITAQFTKVVGEGLLVAKQRREAREAGIDRIAAGMNDARVRQRKVNQPQETKICRHLIDYLVCRRRPSSKPGEVGSAQPT